jgi:hypothetical protein
MHIPHHRLHLQQISQQQFATPNQLVNWMGAMQAQDLNIAVFFIKKIIQVGLPIQPPSLKVDFYK